MKKGQVEKKIDEVLHDYKIRKFFTVIVSAAFVFAVYIFSSGDYFFARVFASVGFLISFFLLDYIFDLRFKGWHYAFVMISVFLNFPLGDLYYTCSWYDKIQHFIFPALMCSIAFHMANRLKIELKWKLIFSFFVVVGILGFFEIVEYGLDSIFGLTLQGVFVETAGGLQVVQSRLEDTMIDLILGFAGAGVYVLLSSLFPRKLS